MCLQGLCQWCTFLLVVVKGRLSPPGATTFFLFSEAEAGVHLEGSGLRKIFDIHVGGYNAGKRRGPINLCSHASVSGPTPGFHFSSPAALGARRPVVSFPSSSRHQFSINLTGCLLGGAPLAPGSSQAQGRGDLSLLPLPSPRHCLKNFSKSSISLTVTL